MHAVYEYEEALLSPPRLPSGPSTSLFGKKKGMTNQHLEQYASYLHKIFASPNVLLDNKIYAILGMDVQIVTLFKALAKSKVQLLKYGALQYRDEQMVRNNPYKLRKKKAFNFHTLWIVKRPVNSNTPGFAGLDLWMLKFEGTFSLCSYPGTH